ncbi:hypothetical protein [Streptomyces sp. TLI_171]|uniref:hypothetical protein n=1 Tax=Streptomyces sp. TLI_171 TaxID=1938859 RepID=UPI000C61A1FB|nr:hypothetical protein [Streptomyces sp. TLI_171]RKE18678.1 hypothetical protein BX266_1971 [Streptomyces sp. TLI_171]
MEPSRPAGQDWAAVVVWWGPMLVLDGWLLSGGRGRAVAPLLVPALCCAVIAAITARPGSAGVVRLRRAGLGALIAHGLLLALLFVLVAVHPPHIPW